MYSLRAARFILAQCLHAVLRPLEVGNPARRRIIPEVFAVTVALLAFAPPSTFLKRDADANRIRIRNQSSQCLNESSRSHREIRRRVDEAKCPSRKDTTANR
jgi:hypothetical protein